MKCVAAKYNRNMEIRRTISIYRGEILNFHSIHLNNRQSEYIRSELKCAYMTYGTSKAFCIPVIYVVWNWISRIHSSDLFPGGGKCCID